MQFVGFFYFTKSKIPNSWRETVYLLDTSKYARATHTCLLFWLIIYYLNGCIFSTFAPSSIKSHCVCVHTHLSIWVCLYNYSMIVQIILHEKVFKRTHIFLTYYFNTITIVYKIIITIYLMYTCILDIHTTLDRLYFVNIHFIGPYLRPKSKDIHMGVTTS
jgi:hypothetical protein